jgi:hypothetical protein
MSAFSIEEKVLIVTQEIIRDLDNGKISQEEFLRKSNNIMIEYIKVWEIEQVEAGLRELSGIDKDTVISRALLKRRDELTRK